jgi:hypothetical protein
MATRTSKPQPASPSAPQPSPEVSASEATAVAPTALPVEKPENPLVQALSAKTVQTELFQKLSAQADAARSISFDLLAATIGDDLFISMLDALQLEGRDSFPETEWSAIVTLHEYMTRHKLSDPKSAIAQMTQPATEPEPVQQTRSNNNGNGKAPTGGAMLPQQAQEALKQGAGQLQRNARQQGVQIGVNLGYDILDTAAETAMATVYAATHKEPGENAPQWVKDRHAQTRQKYQNLSEVVDQAFTKPLEGGIQYGGQYLQEGLEEGEVVLPLNAEMASLFSGESTEPLFSFNGL